MKYYEGVTEALQKGKCFSQGNYRVSSHNASRAGWCSVVFYHGHRVFQYSHHPKIHKDYHEYDFCIFVGYSKTTRLINYCLAAVNAKYRVHCCKGKVIEMPVSKSKKS